MPLRLHLPWYTLGGVAVTATEGMEQGLLSVHADELNGRHIGAVVRFSTRLGVAEQVLAEITGELREVAHYQSETVIRVIAHDGLSRGGESMEFVLDQDEEVCWVPDA